MGNKTPDPTIAARVPQEVRDWVEAQAKKNCVKPSVIVRWVLEGAMRAADGR